MMVDMYFLTPEIYITFWLMVFLIQFAMMTSKKHNFLVSGKLKQFVMNPIPCVTALMLVLSVYYFFLQTNGPVSFMSLSGIYSSNIIFYVSLLLAFLFILYMIHLSSNLSVFYSYEFYIVIFFSFISLNLLLMSCNFLNLFIFIEIYSLCMYYLMGSSKNSVRGMEAAVKYFIMGSFSSAILLFGMFLVYYSTGSLDLFDIFNLTYSNDYYQKYLMYIVGCYFMCFSFLMKMGASVFFFWMVEVYDGIGFNILIFLNIFPKIVYMLTLLNLMTKFNLGHLALVVKILMLSSLLVGLLGALTEIKVKSFLVFTSMYNITFFSIPFWGLSIEMIGVFIFFSSMYLLNFFVFMTLFANLSDMRTEMVSKSLLDLYEMKAQNPQLAWLFVFFAFFASGLPMTMLFLAKFSFFIDLSKTVYMLLLVYFLILGTLSLFYYLRIMKVVLQGTMYPNMLMQPMVMSSALMYTSTIFFNIFFIFFYDDFLLVLNSLMINAM